MNRQWRDNAACRGEDPTIFHLLAEGDPGLDDLSRKERKELERSNFQKARMLCVSCPVILECRQEGEVKDTTFGEGVFIPGTVFSVWGGSFPKGWTGAHQGRPKKSRTVTPEQTCRRGHTGRMGKRKNGERRCLECDRENKQKYTMQKSGENYIPRVSVKVRHELDEFDHAYVEYRQKNGRTRCKVCKQRDQTAYDASRTREAVVQ